jgi:hypothetical protein
MPNRIIREGWIDSERINQIDAAEERFYLRLCLKADDFGRYPAHPTLLKSTLFPLRDDVRNTDIPRWIAACEKAGLVRCYEVASKRYIEIDNFRQRTRSEESKYPAPPNDGLPSGACQTDDGHPRTEASSESKTETETKAPTGAVVPAIDPEPTIPIPSVILTEAFKTKWAEYVEYRKKRRLAVLIPTSIKAQWAKLAEYGHDGAIESIDQTIRNQWQGLFPPKWDLPNSRPLAPPPPTRIIKPIPSE